MNTTKISRFLLAVILLVAAAFTAVACDNTTYKINVTCDTEKGTYQLDPSADSYKTGDEVTLTVTPKSGYEIDAVKKGDNVLAGTNGSYKITVEKADVNVIISFKEKEVPPPTETYTVKVNFNDEQGSAELSPVKEAYNEGDNLTLKVTPNEGYIIKSVTANGTALSAEGEVYKLTVAKENITIEVTFEQEEPPVATYTVETKFNAEQGKVELDPAKEAYNEGDVITINVTPNEGYIVKSVTANGTELTVVDGVLDHAVYNFTVAKENVEIEVTFEEDVPPVVTYTVETKFNAEQGKVELDPAKEAYNEGDVITINVTPNEGYIVKSVTANEVALTAEDGVYKVTVAKENITVEAIFEEAPVSDNLWTGKGAGTTADPFILSGLNGTITVPHKGLKDDGKPSNTREWMKWTPVEPGKYVLKSMTGEGVTSSNARLKITKNGTVYALGNISPGSAITETDYIEIKEGDGINEIWISYPFSFNYNTNVVIVFEKAEVPPQPTVPDTNADDYVGSWETSEMGIKLLLNITKVSDTVLEGALLQGGQTVATLKFVKGSDNVWKNAYDDYTVAYSEENKTVTLSDGESSFVMTKAQPEEPINIPEIFHGKWIGNGENEYRVLIAQSDIALYVDGEQLLGRKGVKVEGKQITLVYEGYREDMNVILVLNDSNNVLAFYIEEVSEDGFVENLINTANGIWSELRGNWENVEGSLNGVQFAAGDIYVEITEDTVTLVHKGVVQALKNIKLGSTKGINYISFNWKDETLYIGMKQGTVMLAVSDFFSNGVAFSAQEATYTVKAEYDNTQGNVKITPSKRSYKEGEEITVNVTPSEGYSIKSVVANGTELTAGDGVYKITVAKENINIVVTFEQDLPPVNAEDFVGDWNATLQGMPYVFTITSGTDANTLVLKDNMDVSGTITLTKGEDGAFTGTYGANNYRLESKNSKIILTLQLWENTIECELTKAGAIPPVEEGIIPSGFRGTWQNNAGSFQRVAYAKGDMVFEIGANNLTFTLKGEAQNISDVALYVDEDENKQYVTFKWAEKENATYYLYFNSGTGILWLCTSTTMDMTIELKKKTASENPPVEGPDMGFVVPDVWHGVWNGTSSYDNYKITITKTSIQLYSNGSEITDLTDFAISATEITFKHVMETAWGTMTDEYRLVFSSTDSSIVEFYVDGEKNQDCQK